MFSFIALRQIYNLPRRKGEFKAGRPVGLKVRLVLNRAQSNLAMARFKLSDVEGRVEV